MKFIYIFIAIICLIFESEKVHTPIKNDIAKDSVAIFRKFDLLKGNWKILGTNYSDAKRLKKVGIYNPLSGWFELNNKTYLKIFKKDLVGKIVKVDDTVTPDLNIILIRNDTLVWEGHIVIYENHCEIFNKNEGYSCALMSIKMLNFAEEAKDSDEYFRIRKKGSKI